MKQPIQKRNGTWSYKSIPITQARTKTETKILELHNQGKSPDEIGHDLNRHPKRIRQCLRILYKRPKPTEPFTKTKPKPTEPPSEVGRFTLEIEIILRLKPIQ